MDGERERDQFRKVEGGGEAHRKGEERRPRRGEEGRGGGGEVEIGSGKEWRGGRGRGASSQERCQGSGASQPHYWRWLNGSFLAGIIAAGMARVIGRSHERAPRILPEGSDFRELQNGKPSLL